MNTFPENRVNFTKVVVLSLLNLFNDIIILHIKNDGKGL